MSISTKSEAAYAALISFVSDATATLPDITNSAGQAFKICSPLVVLNQTRSVDPAPAPPPPPFRNGLGTLDILDFVNVPDRRLELSPELYTNHTADT